MGPCKMCLGNGTTGNPCEACGAGLGDHIGPTPEATQVFAVPEEEHVAVAEDTEASDEAGTY